MGARQTLSRNGIAVMELPDTLLGFETTSPSPLRPECGKPGVVRSPGRGVGVLSPRLWWWGVVFDLWIVVASIKHWGRVFLVFVVQF